jgi:cell wall-associated NlpC family hydrolase
MRARLEPSQVSKLVLRCRAMSKTLRLIGCVLASAQALAACAEPASPTDPMGDFIAQHVATATRSVATPQASELVVTALNFLDSPYRRGGSSFELGFDCSGFTRHVFKVAVGVALPRRADEQARSDQFVPIERQALVPGDLVFFNTLRQAFSHVGIYLGDGKFIHAPRSGSAVRVEDMRADYWARRFDGARRAALFRTAE